MKPYKHLLFDLDNTLLDFSKSSRDALLDVHLHYGIPHTEENLKIYHDINHALWVRVEKGEILPSEVAMTRFGSYFNHFSIEVDSASANAFYLDAIAHYNHIIPGAIELLEDCRSSYSIHIITNGLKDVQRKRLKSSGIENLVDHIFISDEMGVSKPDERYFDHVFKEIPIGKVEDALVIGDGLNSDMEGGINYGIDTCWYNPSSSPSTKEVTYQVKHIRELKELLIQS